IRGYGDAPAMADVDGDRMKQVFWNLSDNAVRAMPEHGKLTVSVRSEGEEGCISFRDTGHGIPAAELEKIFEPFQSGFKGGSGLGLAIVYQIVQAHNAKIFVSSDSAGTEFLLRVKRSESVPRVAEPRLEAAASGGKNG